MKYLLLSFLGFLLILTGCAGNDNVDYNYPKGPKDERKAERGSMTEQGGLFDFLGDTSRKRKGAYIGVNSYLWRASLDTVSFMPLSSADPFGGVILTDWFEDPSNPGERFKANIFIMSGSLQPDAVKVKIFKQKTDKNGNWKDEAASKTMSDEMEDLILTRARQLKISAIKE